MSSSFPKATQDMGQKVYETTDQLTHAALSHLLMDGVNDRTSAMYVSLMSAAPAVRFVSSLIGKERTRETSKELILVTALILGRMVQPDGDGVRVDFTPRNVLAAVEAAKKLVDNPAIAELLDPNMVRSFTESVQEKGETLGYWDYLKDVGPSFDGFGDNIVNFTRH